jgi:hypothetical protein
MRLCEESIRVSGEQSGIAKAVWPKPNFESKSSSSFNVGMNRVNGIKVQHQRRWGSGGGGQRGDGGTGSSNPSYMREIIMW